MFEIVAEPPAERYAELLKARSRERLAHRIARATRGAAARPRPTRRRWFGRRLRPAGAPIPAASPR